MYYFVGDNNVKPVWTELMTHLVQRSVEKTLLVDIKKSVDIKLPFPYSNCSGSINPGTSYLVKEIIEQDIAYSKKFCTELCYDNYLGKYALSRNVSKLAFKGNCSHFCPLECVSTSFEVFQTEAVSNRQTELTKALFYLSDPKYAEISQTVKTTEADLVSNTGGVLGLFLEMSFLSAYRFVTFVFDIILA